PSPLDVANYPTGPIGAPENPIGTPTLGGSTTNFAAGTSVTGAGGAPAAPTPTGAGAGTSLSQLVSDPMGALKGIAETPIKNPLGLALGAGALGYDVIQGQKMAQSEKSLLAGAQQQGALGAQLSSYLATGTLPPGLQTALNNATASAKAK